MPAKAVRFCCFATFLAIAAIPGIGQNAAKSPILVELFTSQGCDSCPPADKLLGKLAGAHADDGRLIVTISEHVTYWNHDGWTDPFSLDAVTERQNAYVSRFNLQEPATPQMVVNGQSQFNGSDTPAIIKAIRAVPPSPDQLVFSSLNQDGDSLIVTYDFTGNLPKRGLDLNAVVISDSAQTHVTKGENSGATLDDTAIARSWQKGKIEASGKGTIRVQLPRNVTGSRHVILFAQERGLGSVVAVAAAPLKTADVARSVAPPAM